VFAGANLRKPLFAEVVQVIRSAGVVSAVIGAAVLTSPSSAAADQNAYLLKLLPKYVFLTPQQLLVEGDRVCAAERDGTLSPDKTAMVANDLMVSVSVAIEIVSAAEWDLC
jgi:hypothetical protein